MCRDGLHPRRVHPCAVGGPWAENCDQKLRAEGHDDILGVDAFFDEDRVDAGVERGLDGGVGVRDHGARRQRGRDAGQEQTERDQQNGSHDAAFESPPFGGQQREGRPAESRAQEPQV